MQSLEEYVERARNGDQQELERVVKAIQDKVYGLALRMLWNPEDARDATQEILLRVMTHLGSFKGESKFTTWVYRIAANYLLSARKSRTEGENISFDLFGKQLDQGLGHGEYGAVTEAEQRLLVEEVKIGCTLGMLLCLGRERRIAYILGEIFELSSPQAAEILDLSPEAYRKQLSRARQLVRDFMQQKCGIINPDNPCRCAKRIKPAIANGRVDPRNLLFVGKHVRVNRRAPISSQVKEMESLERSAALYRSHPQYAAPEVFLQQIKDLITSGAFEILSERPR